MADPYLLPAASLLLSFITAGNHERENVERRIIAINFGRLKATFMHVLLNGIGITGKKNAPFSKFTIYGFEQCITLEVRLQKLCVQAYMFWSNS